MSGTTETKRQTARSSGSENTKPPNGSTASQQIQSGVSVFMNNGGVDDDTHTDQKAEKHKAISGKSTGKTDSTPMPRQRYLIILFLIVDRCCAEIAALTSKPSWQLMSQMLRDSMFSLRNATRRSFVIVLV